MTAGRPRTVDLAGPVHVVEYGSGRPPIVCVHGLGGSAADWQLLAPRLAADRRVVALDLPGFGVTPLAGRSATIAHLRALLDRFLREHIGEPAVLVGNSMGAMLAVLQAVRCPASVDRLVLLSPVVPISARRLPHVLTVGQFLVYATPRIGESFVRARRRRISPAALVDTTLRYIAFEPDRIPRSVVEERTRLAQRRAGDPTGDRAFLSAVRSLLGLLATSRRYRRHLDQVAVPVLVVHGDRDRLVSARAVRSTTTDRKDWTVVVLDEVGHVPQLEAVDDVTVIMRDWLQLPRASSADSAVPGQAVAGSWV
ncbi:MAG: alpha/beta hydrolase [Actinobacteria bacterium]|nr:alpha/beta hydrolase [Actinomycetota bacterium]